MDAELHWSLEGGIIHLGASWRESWEARVLNEQKNWRSQMEGSEGSGEPREKRATRSTAKTPLGNRGAHRMRSVHLICQFLVMWGRGLGHFMS